LLQTITGLTSRTHEPPTLFALDLNCAIYHCVRKVHKTFPYSEENRPKWEDRLIQSVLAYIQQMTNLVNPTTSVYVAVDGVAPMAKIKQQRARRFRSPQEAEMIARLTAEAKNITYIPQPRWDTTAITPGTLFMEKLSAALRQFSTSNKKYIVSPADEPGEGEQKIMDYVRKHRPQSTVVYGLDADLIVLSLLTAQMTKTQVDLFREETEMNGTIKVNALNDEQFLYLNIQQLANTLYSKYAYESLPMEQFIYDFVGLMSLLGNDFVPHGLALKIRDDGIPALMEMYSELQVNIVDKTWSYNHYSLVALFRALKEQEEILVTKAIQHKLQSRVGNSGKDPVEQAIARYNDLPVQWGVEKDLVTYQTQPGVEKPVIVLRSDWKPTYDKMVYGETPAEKVTELYLQSIAWTLRYYSGQPIDTWFYYPWYLPPRAETVVEWLQKNKIHPPIQSRPALKAHHQLAMVLPAESYHLLPSQYADIPRRFPYAFPTSWSVYSFGRRFTWECEPQIPLIQPFQITGMVGVKN